MTTPLFQLSIDGQNIGMPMEYEEGCKWQDVVAKTFPDKVVWLKKVAQYVVPVYTVDTQPALLILGREGFC